MNRFCSSFIILLLVGCATLTKEGQRISVVGADSSDIVSDCKKLSSVTGYAILGWGNDVGLEQAYVDARNKAGRIKDADTMAIVSQRRMFNGGEVSGFVYNCKEKRVQLTQEVPNKSEQTKPNREESIHSKKLFEKAKKCQDKGGVWVTGQCVISIE